MPDMLNSRGSHACAVFDDKLYAIGGYAALKPLVGDILSCSLLAIMLFAADDMLLLLCQQFIHFLLWPALHAHFQAVRLQFCQKIGSDNVMCMQRNAEVYDPRANRWQAIASMNDTRAYFAGVACQGALYAIGGLSPARGNPYYKQTFEKYDPIRDSWEVLQPAANTLSDRAFMSACVV